MMSASHVLSSPLMNKSNSQKKAGHIQVIFGPMFSGKTTELMRRMKRYQIANYKCLIVKYAKDVRYDKDGISTHDRQTLPAVAAEKLMTLTSLVEDVQIIGIDEGQFFPDVVLFCDEMAEAGKTVIVAALDGTFQREGFGDILNLVPHAESVIKLSAVCMTCSGDGHFTKRITKDQSVEVIGGADMYQAVCRDCFRSPNKKSPRKKPSPIKSPRRSPYNLSETPMITQTSVPLDNITNRQLFVSSPPTL